VGTAHKPIIGSIRLIFASEEVEVNLPIVQGRGSRLRMIFEGLAIDKNYVNFWFRLGLICRQCYAYFPAVGGVGQGLFKG
jgi:hypothetical protein